MNEEIYEDEWTTAKELVESVFCRECGSDCFEDGKCVWMTIKEALEKQIRKKPKHEHLNFYCPSCGKWLLWDDAEPNENDLFCPKCSQAIDWEDEKCLHGQEHSTL